MSKSRSLQDTWRLVVCDLPRQILGAPTKQVALTLSTYSNADGRKVHPGETRLVDDTGLSLSTVRRALRTLRDLQLITRVSEGSRHGRRGQADEYELTLNDARLTAAWRKAGSPVRETRARVTADQGEHRSEKTRTPVREDPNTGQREPPPDQGPDQETNPRSSDLGADRSASTQERMIHMREMTLTEFLLARIAEDEEFARRAQKSYQHVYGIPHYFDPTPGEFATPMVGMTPRVALAECEAKRRIVERLTFLQDVGPAVDNVRALDMQTGGVAALRDAVTFLALPYADHPDYLEEWRP